MRDIRKILCPVDFFPASDAAAQYAAALGENYDATIHLLHVVTPFPSIPHVTTSLEECAADALNKLAARIYATGVDTATESRVGDVYDEINRAIEEVKPDLIVMGKHGRRGVERWVVGSTAEKLFRRFPVPLVTITAPGAKFVAPPRRIMVATDFSEGTSDALAHAFSVARENESTVLLLHVVSDVVARLSGKYLDSLINGMRQQLEDMVPPEVRKWFEIVTRVETGTPCRVIKRVQEDDRSDLLIMNIHRKGTLERAALGSTAERLVRTADCPVLLIPPPNNRKARPVRIAARKRSLTSPSVLAVRIQGPKTMSPSQDSGSDRFKKEA